MQAKLDVQNDKLDLLLQRNEELAVKVLQLKNKYGPDKIMFKYNNITVCFF